MAPIETPRQDCPRGHAFLLALSDRLRPLADPIAIQSAATELLADELAVARCYYAEVDEARGASVIRSQALRRGAPPIDEIAPCDGYPTRAARLHDGPIVVEDWEKADEAGRAGRARQQIRAQIAAPLLKDGKLLAVLTVTDDQPRRWTEGEVALVTETAERTWTSVVRAQAEAALRASEEKYRSLFETMDEGYALAEIVRDSEGRAVDLYFIEFNRALEQLVGIPQKALAGTLRSQGLRKPSPDPLAHFAAAVDRNQVVRFQHFSEDFQRWYDTRVHPRGGDRIAVIYDDITTRKLADQTLREGEARHRYLLALSDGLRALTDGDAICGAATRLLAEQVQADRCYYTQIDDERAQAWIRAEHLRASAPTMTGRYRLQQFEEFIARLRAGVPLVIHDWQREHLEREAAAEVSARHIGAQISVPLVKAGRLVASLTVNQTSPRQWRDSEVTLVADTAERTWEAVERARIEAALREGDRRKDAFIATLSHELRNPLAAIRAAALVLSDAAPSRARRTDAVAVVERQAVAMSRLLDDLLDTSRINLGRLAIEKKRVGVEAVIKIALEAARPLIDAAGHTVSLVVRPRGLKVDADPVRLAQVVANLLTNAAKYTPEGGRIAIRAGVERDHVVIEIADNGAGLAPEEVDRLFDMYAQGENTRERSKGGIGIGLALARGILELHGGWVRAESDGPAQGSRFIVGLPRVAGDVVAAAKQRPASRARRQRALRLLVADDSTDFLSPLSALLRKRGHQVFTARDGVTALAEAERIRPDALVLDVGMPGLDGYEVAQRVRATSWGHRVSLVALTGWGTTQDRRRAKKAGFDAHITKGGDIATLFAVLDGCGTRKAASSRS